MSSKQHHAQPTARRTASPRTRTGPTHPSQSKTITAKRRRWIRPVVTVSMLSLIIGVVAAMMLTSRPKSSSAVQAAPTFSLKDTAGKTISLSDYRGRNVVLYFSEGAGCGSCLQQMAAIEKDAASFARAGVTVLPIVMNSRESIMHDMSTYGVTTPFLLDDGTVSRAYDTLGHGMHAGLPGHSFVLIDSQGMQRWKGEYPSMWLTPADLLKTVQARLNG